MTLLAAGVLGGAGYVGYKGFTVAKEKIESVQTTQSSRFEELSQNQQKLQRTVNDSLSSAMLNLTINGQKVPVNMAENTINVEAPTLNCDATNKITLKVPKNTTVTINGQNYKNGG